MAFLYKISPDALDGPDDTTWEWQEEIGERKQIEREVNILMDTVVALAGGDTRPVARVLFAEHEDDSYSDQEITDEEYDDIWTDTRDRDVRRCGLCFQDEWTIWERIRTGQGDPVDSLREHEGFLICGCCQEIKTMGTPVFECIRCSNCLLTERMGRRYGITMVSSGGGGFPVEYVCSVCDDIYPELVGDYDETGEWTQLLDGTWVSDTGEVYEGEYENVDPPENNTEIAKEIKGTIAEIGENLFDVKEKLTEGEYLKLMDLLQKVTNDVNEL